MNSVLKDFSSQFLRLYGSVDRDFLKKFGIGHLIEIGSLTFRTHELRLFRMFIADLLPWVYKSRSFLTHIFLKTLLLVLHPSMLEPKKCPSEANF